MSLHMPLYVYMHVYTQVEGCALRPIQRLPMSFVMSLLEGNGGTLLGLCEMAVFGTTYTRVHSHNTHGIHRMHPRHTSHAPHIPHTYAAYVVYTAYSATACDVALRVFLRVFANVALRIIIIIIIIIIIVFKGLCECRPSNSRTRLSRAG